MKTILLKLELISSFLFLPLCSGSFIALPTIAINTNKNPTVLTLLWDYTNNVDSVTFNVYDGTNKILSGITNTQVAVTNVFTYGSTQQFTVTASSINSDESDLSNTIILVTGLRQYRIASQTNDSLVKTNGWIDSVVYTNSYWTTNMKPALFYRHRIEKIQ